MLSLNVIYRENRWGRWDAYVEQYPRILIKNQDEFNSAKVFLKVLAHEELGAYMIGKETIYYQIRGGA